MSSGSSRTELLEQLGRLGVETVTARYDGSGDEGQIEEPDFGSAAVPAGLAEAVQDFFYEILEDEYAGWENNEGSFGGFVWDLRTDRVNLVHNQRVEEVETEERTL